MFTFISYTFSTEPHLSSINPLFTTLVLKERSTINKPITKSSTPSPGLEVL